MRVTPPFLAAVLMELSTLKQRVPNQQVPFAVPTLVPTGLEVALTGEVIEQEANEAVRITPESIAVTFFILIIV